MGTSLDRKTQMRIAEIVGTVTLNRSHPSLAGATFKLAVPLSLDNLLDREPPQSEQLVLYDELGSGIGSRVALSESREAAAPFRPEVKPVDAYNAAILDNVTIAPHLGSATEQTRRKMAEISVENLFRGLRDEPLLHEVSE